MNKILSFIVNERNELLLLKGSPNDPQFKKSLWYVVTGGCEKFDKTKNETVKREVKEETNLDINKMIYLNWILKYNSLGSNCTEYVYMAFVENKNIILNEENTFEVTPGGFIYNYDDLLATVRLPPTLGIEPLCVGAIVSLEGWETKGSNALFLFIDSNGKAYFVMDGGFFLVERIEERIPGKELYLWEEWADKDRPWDPYY